MLGLPGGFARAFNMWGGVGWGVLTLGFICKHGTLPVCHAQMCHATGVSCVIVDGVFNVFLLCLVFLCVSNIPLSFLACASTRTYRDMRPWEQGVISKHFQTKDSHHILHTHNQTLVKYSYTSYSVDIGHQSRLMQFIQNRKRQLLPAR